MLLECFFLFIGEAVWAWNFDNDSIKFSTSYIFLSYLGKVGFYLSLSNIHQITLEQRSWLKELTQHSKTSNKFFSPSLLNIRKHGTWKNSPTWKMESKSDGEGKNIPWEEYIQREENFRISSENISKFQKGRVRMTNNSFLH